MDYTVDRRGFLKCALGASAVGAIECLSAGAFAQTPTVQHPPVNPRADSMILIWLPGGIAQTDTWDPKKYTPFRAGMKGNELLGTCEAIPSSADGIFLGKGLENIASVMDRGTILRSLTNETKFGAIHLKAQYYM